ncbi:MAG: transcription antitermination factor NusB [Alphaproteobacteria bacterium]|nr:transcription antitermination factor NusB [Alphaproteobacteria bacterium]MDE2629869.1 transcription antitermination factor NusB [Alphaproteobacteria bacterium]
MNAPKPDAAARRAARLAAVQALYQMELTGEDAGTVAAEFVAYRFGREPEQLALGEPDQAFFADVVRGVPHHQAEIDAAITECLASDWRLSRVDSILRAILRAGAYELIARADVPVKVIIDEYVELSHAFFSGEEPAFVNAALDKLAHRKRAAEFGEPPPDDEVRF